MNDRREENYVGFGSAVSPGDHNITFSYQTGRDEPPSQFGAGQVWLDVFRFRPTDGSSAQLTISSQVMEDLGIPLYDGEGE